MADPRVSEAYQLYSAQKYEQAFDLFFDMSLEGNGEAAYCAGVMLLNGVGTGADADKAKDFLEQAVDAGYIPACAELADVIAMEEERKAFMLFSKGAQSGDQYAMNRLSKFFDEGIGTRVNKRKGDFWYNKSNETGDVPAMVEEAVALVLSGNYIQARIFLMRAGVMGDPLSAAVISRMYREGLGVKADEETSGVWADIAFAYGWNELDPAMYKGLRPWFDATSRARE